MNQPRSVRITGWGMYAPEQRLTNADLERLVDTSDEWIQARTGIKERRIAAPDETTGTMAVAAGRAALAMAGVDPADLDRLRQELGRDGGAADHGVGSLVHAVRQAQVDVRARRRFRQNGPVGVDQGEHLHLGRGRLGRLHAHAHDQPRGHGAGALSRAAPRRRRGGPRRPVRSRS